MKTPPTYFIKRAGVEAGPLTVAQVNRMKQRGEIAADTPCRLASDTDFRRLDEVLPHLRHQAPDMEKVAQVTKAVVDYEIKTLTGMTYGTSIWFWIPSRLGFITAVLAFSSGIVLFFKHRKPIGLLGIVLGGFGVYFRLFVMPHW